MTGTGMSLWEEHLFWLEVLQDHAFFVRDQLSPLLTTEVHTAQHFIDEFGQHLDDLRRLDPAVPAAAPEAAAFAEAVWPTAFGYYQFEGRMQSLRVQNLITINLTPTYFNGTLSENNEYLRLLDAYKQGREPLPLPLWSLLDLWLEDQLGHAVLLRNVADPIELEVLKQCDHFVALFQGFILQNHHIRGYLRFAPPGIPRQRQLASDVGRAAIDMNTFIVGTIARYKEKRLLNRTTLRFLQHHLPEACYFIRKLSVFAPELREQAAACSTHRPAVTEGP